MDDNKLRNNIIIFIAAIVFQLILWYVYANYL